jgi:hypothetical protein
LTIVEVSAAVAAIVLGVAALAGLIVVVARVSGDRVQLAEIRVRLIHLEAQVLILQREARR